MKKTTAPFFLFSRFRLCRWLGAATLITGILAGCSSNDTLPSSSPVDEQLSVTSKVRESETVEVIRYNRYTLVEVGATANQQEILSQIIDVTIPALTSQSATVLEAMQYVLLNSGYRLCTDESIHAFHGFPLPLAHRQLGPITLKEALSILAGSGWQLQADHQKRVVCFASVQPESEIQLTDQGVQP